MTGKTPVAKVMCPFFILMLYLYQIPVFQFIFVYVVNKPALHLSLAWGCSMHRILNIFHLFNLSSVIET